MALTNQDKLNMILYAIREDRAEIRFQEGQIISFMNLIVISSFGLTALALTNKQFPGHIGEIPFKIFADSSFIIIFLALYAQLNGRLRLAQTMLEGREEMLRLLSANNLPEPFDVYRTFDDPDDPKFNLKTKPATRHANINAMFIAALTVLVAKLAMVALNWI